MRIQRRKEIRDAQIAFGDREVFVNDKGEKMSRLKVRLSIRRRIPALARGCHSRLVCVVACLCHAHPWLPTKAGLPVQPGPPLLRTEGSQTAVGMLPSHPQEVNDDWILRRLERWGKRDGMPFVGASRAER